MKCHGNHKLIVVYRHWFSEFEAEVVRWCKVCGAVVVDTDFDNRTQPGDVMEMMFPEVK